MYFESLFLNSVQWWSFAVLIFEMIYGSSPFASAHTNEDQVLYENIKHKELNFHGQDSVTVNFLSHLFQRNPRERLGVPDDNQVLRHPFFNPLNRQSIRELKVQPPFVPSCNSMHDITRYFDEDFTARTLAQSLGNPAYHEARYDEFFRDFEYVNTEVFERYKSPYQNEFLRR